MIKKKTRVEIIIAPVDTDLAAVDLEDRLNSFIDDAEDDNINFEVIDIKYSYTEKNHAALLIYSTLEATEDE